MVELSARGEDLNEFEEKLGGTREVCKMKTLAKLMRAQGLEVATHDFNMSASLLPRRQGIPFYTDKLSTTEFHYKSSAVQMACSKVFNQGFHEIAAEAANVYKRVSQQGLPEVQMIMALARAAKSGCSKVRPCIDERRNRAKMREPSRPDDTVAEAVADTPGNLYGEGLKQSRHKGRTSAEL